MTLAVGDKVPEFSLFRGFKDLAGSSELFAAGPTVLTFYLFDFTGNPEGG